MGRIGEAARVDGVRAEEASAGRMRFGLWCLAVALGAFAVLSSRAYMNLDGISYLDMGDAFWRRDWHTAIEAIDALLSTGAGVMSPLMSPARAVPSGGRG